MLRFDTLLIALILVFLTAAAEAQPRSGRGFDGSAADTDGDGSISRVEFEQWSSAMFEQLDANNPACLASLTLAGTPQAVAFAQLQPILGTAVAGALTTPALSGPGAFLNCFPFAAPALGVAFLPAQFDLTFEDDEFIYTGQIGWEPNPDLLTYASFTHGYKAGGFNLDSTAAANGGDPRFRSSWEVSRSSH